MRKLLSGIFLALLFVTSHYQVASADVNNFVVNNFHARYELSEGVKGGGAIVKERLTVTFTDYNHGILRAIPKSYDGHSVKPKVTEVKRDDTGEPFSTYSDSNDNLVIKIGDPNKTITGQHSYEITYHLRGVIHFLDEPYDEFYWDINGTDWQQQFEQVSAEVVFISGGPLTWPKLPYPRACYTGREGQAEQTCQFETTQTG
jgi:hypothetical protein